MKAVDSFSLDRQKDAEVICHGFLRDVWLRRDMSVVSLRDDTGEDRIRLWKCRELHFVTDDDLITEQYAAGHMDELWSEHEDG